MMSAVERHPLLPFARMHETPTKRLGAGESFVALAFFQDARRLAIATQGGTIRIWDVLTGEQIGQVMKQRSTLQTIAISASGMIASAGDAGQVFFWDSGTSQLAFRSKGQHGDRIFSVAFSPDGAKLVSGSADHTLMIWSAYNGDLIAGPFHSSSTIRCIVFSPDGCALASAEEDDGLGGGYIKVRSTETWRETHTPIQRKTIAMSIAWSPSGREIVSGCLDGTLRFFQVSTGRELRKIHAHNLYIYGVVFLPNGRFVASASWDGSVNVWDITSPMAAVSSLAHSGPVSCLAVSPDGRYIASVAATLTSYLQPSGERSVSLWNTHDSVPSLAHNAVGALRAPSSGDSIITPTNGDLSNSPNKQHDEPADESSEPSDASEASPTNDNQGRPSEGVQARKSESSSVRNFLDMPAVLAAGTDEIIGGDNPALPNSLDRFLGQASSDASAAHNMNKGRILSRAQNRILNHARRLQGVLVWGRRVPKVDRSQKEPNTAHHSDVPPITMVTTGRDRNPVVILPNTRDRKWRRKKDHMTYEDWMKQEEEKEQRRRQRVESSSSAPRVPSTGASVTSSDSSSSSSDSWETYYTGSSAFWNWLCFKCTCSVRR